jgi:hypothetical protein
MKKIIKYFLASLLAVGTLAVIAININLAINSVSESSLSMAKTETYFTFNNQFWDTESHWYNGGSWYPYLHACEGSGGSYKVTVYVKGVDEQPSTSKWAGQAVKCQGGNGNCFNGTSCKLIFILRYPNTKFGYLIKLMKLQ